MIQFGKIKRVLKFSACLILFTLFVSSTVYSFQITDKKKDANFCNKTKAKKKEKTNSLPPKKKITTEKMKNTDSTFLSPGIWGARGVNLVIEDDGANIEYDCALGKIEGKILVTGQGDFKVSGTYTILSGGPVSIDQPNRKLTVVFEGSIKDDKMTLSVISPDDDNDDEKVLQKNTLEKGSFGRIYSCN